MRLITKIAAGLVGLFAALQLIRPEISHPPVKAEIQVPAGVKEILKNSCYDCHSNETKLAWFDQIVPVYWLVAHDVKRARARLNFSEIGEHPPGSQRSTLFEAVNQIRLGAMPLPSYVRAHPSSAMSEQQLAVLENYLDPFKPPPTTQVPPPDQFHSSPQSVRPAANGVAFFPDYKNWRSISSTDRGDNHTLRQILANEIAVNAIAAKQIQPWPDGAVFAKVAWEALSDEHGVIRPGKFIQVEFMIKDQAKYRSTAGWGWARWRGVNLEPYGAHADFAEECVSCHQPVGDQDFVYTLPMERSRP